MLKKKSNCLKGATYIFFKCPILLVINNPKNSYAKVRKVPNVVVAKFKNIFFSRKLEKTQNIDINIINGQKLNSNEASKSSNLEKKIQFFG